jgi:hypothetical protein
MHRNTKYACTRTPASLRLGWCSSHQLSFAQPGLPQDADDAGEGVVAEVVGDAEGDVVLEVEHIGALVNHLPVRNLGSSSIVWWQLAAVG